jgi:hypothetical protein
MNAAAVFFGVMGLVGAAEGFRRAQSAGERYVAVYAGVCLLSMAVTYGFWAIDLWRRRRSLDASAVAIAGGVPIRMRRGFFIVWLSLGALMISGGVPAFWLMGHPIFAGVLVLTALFLFWVLMLFLTGRRGGDYVTFTPKGMEVGDFRRVFRIDWSSIAQVAAGEIHSNAAVLINFRDRAAVAASVMDPSPRAAEKLLKQFGSCRRWQSCDWFILTAQFGLDSILLAKAIERYTANPAARSELAETNRIQASAFGGTSPV